MPKFVWCSLMVLSIAAVGRADESPMFSFQSAREAFESARVPTLEEVAGKWLVVGNVHKYSGSDSGDGYWPDGKFTFPAHGPGYYLDIVAISRPKADVFGKIHATWQEKVVGAGSGKVYENFGPYRGISSSVGFKVGSNTCRIVQANHMLLCEKGANAFVGFKKLP